MQARIPVIVLAVLALASCAPVPKTTAPPPPPAPEAAAAQAPAEPAEPEMKALPPTDVRTMTCATLLGTGDDDKAYASTFLLGYRSALTHMRTIDVKMIETVEEAALAQCAATPQAIASKVFAAVQLKTAMNSETPPHHPHRKRPPLPAATSPQETPAEPSLPPMRYAPAQGAPPPSVQAAPAEPPPAPPPPAEPPSTTPTPATTPTPGEPSAPAAPPASEKPPQ